MRRRRCRRLPKGDGVARCCPTSSARASSPPSRCWGRFLAKEKMESRPIGSSYSRTAAWSTRDTCTSTSARPCGQRSRGERTRRRARGTSLYSLTPTRSRSTYRLLCQSASPPLSRRWRSVPRQGSPSSRWRRMPRPTPPPSPTRSLLPSAAELPSKLLQTIGSRACALPPRPPNGIRCLTAFMRSPLT
jgi:hypothetical protein